MKRRRLTRALVLLALVLGSASATQAQEPQMAAFVMDYREGGESAVDLSFLLHAPAGGEGFLAVRDGHFFQPSGERIRFWGVNVTDWSPGSVMLPPKGDAALWADALARLGVNCVRFHFLDLPAPRGLIDSTRDDSREFDAEQLDRFDFWFAELKKRGIYADINLNVGRSYKHGDGVADYDQIGWAKGVVYFDPRLIELQKEYAAKLLSHRNPYTGTEYRNEPAVAIVEIANENGLDMGYRAPSPHYGEELEKLFNEWLGANRSAEQVAEFRAAAAVEPDATLPRLTGLETWSPSPARLEAEQSFYVAMEAAYFRQMREHLRGIGVKAAIVGTADHSHSSSPYPMLMSTSLLDVMDGHDYWQHPGARGGHNTPMVNDPEHSIVVELSRTAIAGKPYIVSEVNQPFPSDYESESIPILAAYAALQDWDGVFWYTFEPKLSRDWKPFVGDPFDISQDPVKMSQLAMGALMFERGDVSAARETVERSYSREQTFASRLLDRTKERPYFTPGFPLTLPLRHASRIRSLEGEPTGAFEQSESAPIVSDTGQLTWRLAEGVGVVAIDADRSEGLVGFLGDHAARLDHLVIDVVNRHAAVLLTSLDSLPIASSSRLLLAAGSRVLNTGAKWNDSRTSLDEWGATPTLIEPVKGAITLRGLKNPKSVTLQPLDGAGRRSGELIIAEPTEDGWLAAIGEVPTTWYEVVVAR